MMPPSLRTPPSDAQAELRRALSGNGAVLAAVVVFSVFVNLLGLTGSIFMLQVYDRVLGSRSQETLAALFALVVVMFLILGMLDLSRSRVMARVALRFQSRIRGRVFAAMLTRASRNPADQAAASALRDLDMVQKTLASPVTLALLDLPWVPFYLFLVFLLHFWLGIAALAGGVVLVGLMFLNQWTTRAPARVAVTDALAAERLSDQLRNEAEVIQALGMRADGFARWDTARSAALGQAQLVTDRFGLFSVLSRTFRQFLQSALLALGAWLALRGDVTGGAMIAASIMVGRALAPVEQLVNGWSGVQQARAGWGRLSTILWAHPAEPDRTALPRPRAALEVRQVTLAPPGHSQPTLRALSFNLAPGQAIGVIGPSAAGKSTLARALTGVWPVAAGQIRLDGAALDQYDPDVLGRLIGYLPQRVALFDGTIAENIARLSPRPDPAKVVAAAKAAAAHEMILAQPQGYDTRVTQGCGRLSGGQIQRIGLARALYGDPVLLVLDEPNASLDNEGSMGLNSAIRQMKAEGRSVLVMAHRPAAIQECDMLLVLEGGTRRAFGPRDEILRSMLRNGTDISRSGGQGGIA